MDYKTEAEPKAYADGVPVFCAHDKIVDVATLVPNPKNPNQHPDAQIQLLGRIIRQTGWRQPITVSKRSGFIVKGHGRLSAALLEGMKQAPVIMLADLDELRGMNARRKEAMAAQVIFTNACTMDEYVDDFEHFEEREVRYFDGASNPAIYTPTADWTTTEASGKQMISDMASMISMLTSRGLPATDVLVAPDVADIILSNEWILKLLDNRNYQIGGVDPETLPAGATKICRLNIKGHMVDVLSYEDNYTEVDGTVTPYIPAGTIAVGAPAAGRTVYGAITQVEQADGEFHTYTGMNVPKYLSDATHDVREVTLKSAPLCLPNNENPFITAKVVTD